MIDCSIDIEKKLEKDVKQYKDCIAYGIRQIAGYEFDLKIDRLRLEGAEHTLERFKNRSTAT